VESRSPACSGLLVMVEHHWFSRPSRPAVEGHVRDMTAFRTDAARSDGTAEAVGTVPSRGHTPAAAKRLTETPGPKISSWKMSILLWLSKLVDST
jgi:hypothetical protein